MKTYELVMRGTAIRCRVCEMVSYNGNDVAQLFCAKCKRFHLDGPFYHFACDVCEWDDAEAGYLSPYANVQCKICASDTGHVVKCRTWRAK